ncbi:peptidyl-prolyl cis-trans isomerase D [Desulfobotulus alkaliphilus]|uniref:Periplasmic chaperone PpiD n=1 Tax=Desulfobotulus alkaliphilus TaxID=622671 RepID=A0A562RQT6_9BACT|nr:SurA N-terminal domain-containing protein [Desulfobotulus alkaliphilus]TWI70716.1 peptidyl-prolyl cis-trans isomerase D [Desulfobotulus alkaliphilus]
MLARIRAKASSWMVKFILGIIVLVFVFLGVESYHMGQQNKAATVNGKVIAVDDYRAEYQALVDQIRRQFGGTVSHEILELFQVREQALQRLIERELLLQEAARYKLQVTDDEVAHAIASMPFFQKDGRFDSGLYQSLLQANGMSVAYFEERQRQDLLLTKLQDLIFGGVQVSEVEALDFYNSENRKVSIEAAIFRPSDFTPSPVSDEEIMARYESHKEVYRTEPMVKAVFLRFDPENFIDQVRVSEEDLRHTYEMRLASYREPERVAARHILIKTENGEAPDVIAAAEKKILELREKILAGADFSDVAREFSQCPSAQDGGNLGVFPKEAMVAPFSRAAFALDEGELSEPVQTRFGWHLIRVDEKLPEGVKPFEAVAEGIRWELQQEKANHAAFDAADQAYDATLAGADLGEVSRVWNLPLHETAFFGRRGPSSGISDGRAFAEAAFSLMEHEVSELLEINEALYLISVVDRMESRIPPLEEVRERVLADMMKEAADALARKRAMEVLTALKNGEDTEETLTSTGLFGRQEAIPQMGSLPALSRAVFSLGQGEYLPEEPVVLEEGYGVFRIIERALPDEAAFMADRDNIKKELRGRKENRMYAQWMASLKSRAKIMIEPAFQREG